MQHGQPAREAVSRERTTDLVIINAREFCAQPQAVITLPHRGPPGFHGNWVAA